MAKLFTLKIRDYNQTMLADFISGDAMAAGLSVDDGGFNISAASDKPKLVIDRPGGFYIPVTQSEGVRTATIKFSPWAKIVGGDVGAARSDVVEQLNNVRRIIRKAEARIRKGAGDRVELIYAWEGCTYETTFEVYSGSLNTPDDILSVEKMFYRDGDKLLLPECELEMQVSPFGYRNGLLGSEAIPLINPTEGTKTTNAILVQNAWYQTTPTYQWNYVEIDGADLPGSEPWLLELQMQLDATYFVALDTIYIGQRCYPFPGQSLQIYDDGDAGLVGVSRTPHSDSTAIKGSYGTYQKSVGAAGVDYFSSLYWQLSQICGGLNYGLVGVYYAFLNTREALPTYLHAAIGYDDFTEWQIRNVGNFTHVPSTGQTYQLPLGPIQVPPWGREPDMGNYDSSLCMGLYIGYEQSGTISFTLDGITLIPIDDGLRIIRNRGVTLSNLQGRWIVDNGINGLLYMIENSWNYDTMTAPFYGLLEPLRLEPGTDQRLYFYIKSANSYYYYDNKLWVKAKGNPAYRVLAE